MLPALWPGDVVEIRSCSIEDVRPGEILLALRDGRFFLHRLIASNANGFVLRGDSMPGPDPQYPREALLGRLVRSPDREQVFSASVLSRAVGMVICHCSFARRLALNLNGRRRAAGEFPGMESA
jgi:hypothetical protein